MKFRRIFLLVLIFSLIFLPLYSDSITYDILIKNGRVFDGSLKPPFKADIAIIDLKNIKIKTSISNPHQYSEGVKYLLINGELVIDKGKWTGKLPGQIIRLKK